MEGGRGCVELWIVVVVAVMVKTKGELGFWREFYNTLYLQLVLPGN